LRNRQLARRIPGERTRPSAPSTGSGQASGCEVGYGPRDAERLGAILLQTLRVSRRRAFRTGRPVAGIDRRQPSASQVSGTAPRPSRLSCPLPAVRSTPYPPRADAKDYAPAQMTGHKFFEIGRRGAAALGVAQMNACRLGGSWVEQSPPGFAKLASLAKRATLPSRGGKAGTEAAANTESSPRKRGPLFGWPNEVPAFAGMTLWGGAGGTIHQFRHGRTLSGHPAGRSGCADS